MSRRIQTGALPPAELEYRLNYGQSLRRTDLSGADDYFGRLAKYIPAEIVGLYLATAGIVPPKSDGGPRCATLWIVFALNFALVPLYFWFSTTRDKKKPLLPQIVLASVAFPVWVFAIGGPFRCFHWYAGWIGSLLLAFVTVVIGFYRPAPGS